MENRSTNDAKLQMTIRLYRLLPGAEMPTVVDGNHAWGDIDETEAWKFCEAIAGEILSLRKDIRELDANATRDDQS